MNRSSRHCLAIATPVAALAALIACHVTDDGPSPCRLGGPAYEEGHHACR